ncbi:hypothetical protein ACRAWF_24955 [Streptomyces sp. L7]
MIIDMVARGALEPGTTYDGKPTLQLSAAHRAPAPDASDTERKIWSLAACRNPASAAPHNVTHPIAQSLLTEGYLRGNGASIDFRAPRPVWCWTVAAPTLPFAALMMFLLLHWRYAIVAMWTAMAMAVVAWGLTMPTEKPAALRLPVLTERGDQRTEPYAPGEAAAYAVFGLEAYNHFASHTPGFSTAVDKGTADRETERGRRGTTAQLAHLQRVRAPFPWPAVRFTEGERRSGLKSGTRAGNGSAPGGRGHGSLRGLEPVRRSGSSLPAHAEPVSPRRVPMPSRAV